MTSLRVHFCQPSKNTVDFAHLTRWCRGNASALDVRAPRFNSGKGFFLFCFVVVVFLLLSKTDYLLQKFAAPFAM